VVLGAGGVLGASWTIGALQAITEVEGFDPHDADVLVGTSAGSVLAALLGSGLTVADLLAHQRGIRCLTRWAPTGAMTPRPGALCHRAPASASAHRRCCAGR